MKHSQSAWNIFETTEKYSLNLLETLLEDTWELYEKSVKYTWNPFEILLETCFREVLKLSRISCETPLKIPWNTFETS